jgi:hypothetical protein
MAAITEQKQRRRSEEEEDFRSEAKKNREELAYWS